MTPSDALLGNTRLRVSMVYFNETSGPQDPCGQYNWGETEDYCVIIDNFANVEEVDLIASIYPNPVNDILNVSFKNLDTANQIRITDAAGREVFKTNVQSSLTQINTSLFNRGVYFLEILDQGKRIKTKRFIKQ